MKTAQQTAQEAQQPDYMISGSVASREVLEKILNEPGLIYGIMAPSAAEDFRLLTTTSKEVMVKVRAIFDKAKGAQSAFEVVGRELSEKSSEEWERLSIIEKYKIFDEYQVFDLFAKLQGGRYTNKDVVSFIKSFDPELKSVYLPNVPLIKKTASKVILKYYRYNEDALLQKIQSGKISDDLTVNIISNSLHTYHKIFDALTDRQITRIAQAHKEVAHLIFGEGGLHAGLLEKLDGMQISNIAAAHQEVAQLIFGEGGYHAGLLEKLNGGDISLVVAAHQEVAQLIFGEGGPHAGLLEKLNGGDISLVAAAHQEVAQLIFGEGGYHAGLLEKLDDYQISRIAQAHQEVALCIFGEDGLHAGLLERLNGCCISLIARSYEEVAQLIFGEDGLHAGLLEKLNSYGISEIAAAHKEVAQLIFGEDGPHYVLFEKLDDNQISGIALSNIDLAKSILSLKDQKIASLPEGLGAKMQAVKSKLQQYISLEVSQHAMRLLNEPAIFVVLELADLQPLHTEEGRVMYGDRQITLVDELYDGCQIMDLIGGDALGHFVSEGGGGA